MKNELKIELLHQSHDRDLFDCGEEPLNSYLKQFAGQHAKNNISRTFILSNCSSKAIGYYTLSAGSIQFETLPETIKKKLPRYPVPIARIGRLAVDKNSQGQSFGEHLLMDALHRCTVLANEIALVGVVVDAKHRKAKSFYERYGFNELSQTPLTLFISIRDILASI